MLAATFAMGATNAIYAPGSGLPVGLTCISGTLVRLGQTAAQAIAGTGDARAWRSYALHPLALITGALLGALAYASFGPAALAFVALAALVAALSTPPSESTGSRSH